jgi:DNA mismatch repair protein MutL
LATIEVLDRRLVDMIAAGEVIERPASVVKELVENAIDAHADRIEVRIEDGGRRLISVTDSGAGISPDDMKRVFMSHATSKLRDAGGLFKIGTFGFRGEALASIGAVSHARILSRTPDRLEGTEATCDGGELRDTAPAAAETGTVVEVRDLFYNTPARRKFLRSPAVEADHVHEVLTRFAISHREVRLDFIRDGRPDFRIPKAQSLGDRLMHLFGPEVAGNLIHATASDGGTHAEMLFSTPHINRPTARMVYVFVNGRYVRDRFISKAISEAYTNALSRGQYPVVFGFLDVPLDEVDVNVHPAKIEVRFKSPWRVRELFCNTIRRRLVDLNPTPVLVPTAAEAGNHGSPVDGLGRQAAVLKAVEDFFSRDPAHFPPTHAPSTQVFQNHPQGRREPECAGQPAEVPAQQASSGQAVWTRTSPLGAGMRDCMQVHASFIVVETDDGLLIVDQHALHERVLYGRLLSAMKTGAFTRQRLIMPEVVELSHRETALADRVIEALRSLGMEVERFGPSALAVHAVPDMISGANPAKLVRDTLEAVAEEETPTIDGAIDRAAQRMACTAAIKAGQRLTRAEMERLLSDREEVELSATCAHGRPTAFGLSLKELEKYFQR